MIQELQTRYGTMFVPDTDSGQYWWLANIAASPEDEFIEKVCCLLDERPTGIAIDVGANFGCWTLPLSKHATHVYAFEPQKCCSDLIVRSVEANGFDNITVWNVAVGRCTSIVTVPQLDIETAGNFGGVSLLNPCTEGNSVAIMPLDNLICDSDRVTFIKIDVEGGELAVLRGARKLIDRERPILMMEMDHPLTDLVALQQWLTDANYAFDQYGPNYLCMPL